MSRLTFAKATKEQAKLRLALFGPSGAGKTYTALSIASGLGGRVAVIDTERGSASKYADKFEFDVLELPKNDIATYIEGIKAAAGYGVLIIDSLSHAWRELLEAMDQLARTKYGGNKWSAWSEGTPQQNHLVDALLGFDGHVIATMRSKTEWVIQQDERGKNAPKRIGTSPEQGKGIEYEFDVLMEISPEHTGVVTKDRTGKFQDAVMECPGADFGKQLAEWLSTGAPITARAVTPEQVTADPPPTATHAPTKDDRPWTPEQVWFALEESAKSRVANGNGNMAQADAKLRGAVASRVAELFPGSAKEIVDMKRHALLYGIFGRQSTTELTDAESRAFLAWSSDKLDDGQWVASETAAVEAARIIDSVGEQFGQQALI